MVVTGENMLDQALISQLYIEAFDQPISIGLPSWM